MKPETRYLLSTTRSFLLAAKNAAARDMDRLRSEMHLAEQAWADAGCPDASGLDGAPEPDPSPRCSCGLDASDLYAGSCDACLDQA